MEMYTIHPSERLAWVRVILHILAAAALFLADLDAAWRVVGLAAVISSLAAGLRRKRAVELRCNGKGELWLRDGDWIEARVLPDTLVTPTLTVLQLKRTDRRWTQSVAVLGDSLPADDFRRLRLWLRWRARPAGTAADGHDGA